jgi:hypothetical protein
MGLVGTLHVCPYCARQWADAVGQAPPDTCPGCRVDLTHLRSLRPIDGSAAGREWSELSDHWRTLSASNRKLSRDGKVISLMWLFNALSWAAFLFATCQE